MWSPPPKKKDELIRRTTIKLSLLAAHGWRSYLSILGLSLTFFYLSSCKSTSSDRQSVGNHDADLKTMYDNNVYYLYYASADKFLKPDGGMNHRENYRMFVSCVSALDPDGVHAAVLKTDNIMTADGVNCVPAFLNKNLKPVVFDVRNHELETVMSTQTVQSISNQTNQFKDMVGLDEAKVAALQKIWTPLTQSYLPKPLEDYSKDFLSVIDLLKVMVAYLSVAVPNREIIGYCYPIGIMTDKKRTCKSYHPKLGIRRVFDSAVVH